MKDNEDAKVRAERLDKNRAELEAKANDLMNSIVGIDFFSLNKNRSKLPRELPPAKK